MSSWRVAVVESDLPPSAKFVGLLVALHVPEVGSVTPPDLDLIMSESGYSRATVMRSLAGLSDQGFLDRGGKRWRLTLPVLFQSLTDDTSGDPGKVSPVTLGKHGKVSPVRLGKGKRKSQTEVVGIEEAEDGAIIPRRVDLLWEMVCELYGNAPTDARHRGAWNSAVRSLRAEGATPEDLFDWVSEYRGTDKDWAVVTPTALAKHYHRLGGTAANGRTGKGASLARRAAQAAREGR